jgi:hypothetical protein
MKLGRVVSFVLVLLTCVALASPAAAQTDEEIAAGYSALSTTTTSGVVTTVGGIILTVVLVSGNKKSALKRYIRDNAVALKQDITLGGGATVADLGQIFGAPQDQLSGFGRALQARRSTLMELIGTTPIDDPRTDAFIETLWEAVAQNDDLAQAVMEQRMAGG